MPILGARGGASSRGLGQFQGNPTAPTSPVAGYHLWLDADNAASFTYSSGTVVSQWTDRSASAFTFTAVTTSNQPTRNGTQNSKSTVVFDGYDDYLKSTAAASTWKYLHDGTGGTIFVVAKSKEAEPGVSGSNYILDTSYDGLYPDVGLSLSVEGGTTPNRIRFEIKENTVSGSLLFTRRNIPTSEHNVYVAYLDPNNATSAKKLPAYFNGGTEQAPNAVITWPGGSSSNPGTSLTLGTGYDGLFAGSAYSQFMLDGEIAEIITYQSVLSDSNRIANINYLRAKWGI